MQITEDSCVYTKRMIVKGMELLCTYVQEQMIPEQVQQNFVEACSQHVQARYGETRAKKFITLSNKYSRKGESNVSRNRKPRVKKNAHKPKGNWNYCIKGWLLLCRSCLVKNGNQPEHHLESIMKRNHQVC